jgi:polysaccharide deacetylase family protein (PEP-CTERM system associated)
MLNAFTVDVEEHFHAMVFQRAARAVLPLHRQSRVAENTDRLLDLLREHTVLGTFFILGEVAKACPQLVRRIADDGHEIGCHGFHHHLVSSLTPSEFRRELRDAKPLLEDLSGQPVVGFRAPNFSIGKNERWALSILLEQGFAYDSSAYPVRHVKGSDLAGRRSPYEVYRNGDRRLLEFPLATLRLGKMNLPVGGGGYFRLFPVALTAWALHRLNTVEGFPASFFIHPWELDPLQPRPPMSLSHRFRLYVGISRVSPRLSVLLRNFSFGRMVDVLDIPYPSPHRGSRGLEPASSPHAL